MKPSRWLTKNDRIVGEFLFVLAIWLVLIFVVYPIIKEIAR